MVDYPLAVVVAVASRALFKELFEKYGYVFRPFESENRNAVRLSLNVYNTFEEIDRFIQLVE